MTVDSSCLLIAVSGRLAPRSLGRLPESIGLPPFAIRRILDSHVNALTMRNLAEEKGGLSQRGLEIERIQGGDGVFRKDHFKPPVGGTRGGVVDADVGDGAAQNKGIYFPQTQEV